MVLKLETEIEHLTGCGPVRAAAFHKMGIFNVDDLLHLYPRGYQNRGRISTVMSASEQFFITGSVIPSSYILTVSTQPTVATIRGGLGILRFRAFDETGACQITYFNQNYLKNRFPVGSRFRFWGRMTKNRNTLQLTSPVAEAYSEEKELRSIIPIYPLSSGLNQKFISDSIAHALDDTLEKIQEIHTPSTLDEYSLCSLHDAIDHIHRPTDETSLLEARRRLTFDEIFIITAAIASIDKKTRKGRSSSISDTDISPLTDMVEYKLTSAQERSISEILEDMKKTTPMERILTGDVGSGKTIVAAAASFAAIKNGYQTALMVPTEILANQHYSDLEPMFSRLGYECRLLTGSTKQSEKAEIIDRLGRSEVDIVIGTHALLQDSVKFKKLGLVITDEQHRFGVLQRAKLKEKSDNCHMLVMSATPIPRTLSLVYYGSLSVSKLDEMPPGRQRVDTFVVNGSYRERIDRFIEKHVKNGHQVYIVCPAVDRSSKAVNNEDDESYINISFNNTDTDNAELKSAVEYSKQLSARLPDIRIECLHGKMKGQDKDTIMKRFASGETDVLVSTTVIEVGMNVPNATLMIVENAERFGLAQLHQLRGRVGRGKDKSYCILVSDSETEVAKKRLDIMKTTYNGFEIAEEDLKLRGPGDFFGTGNDIKQHGAFQLDIAASCTDEKLMSDAAKAADRLISSDPELKKPENAIIGLLIEKKKNRAENTIN